MTKKVLYSIIGVIFFIFILLIVIGSYLPQPKAEENTSTKQEPVVAEVPTTPQDNSSSEKSQIEKLVTSVPTNGKFSGSGTITKTDVYHVRDLNDASKFSGWGVDVDLHIEGSRAVMNEEMAEIYFALYSNRKDLTSVAVSVYESVTDKYGNQKNMEIYHTFLKADEASKVNWSLNRDVLVYTVLPKLWTTNLDMSASNPDLLMK